MEKVIILAIMTMLCVSFVQAEGIDRIDSGGSKSDTASNIPVPLAPGVPVTASNSPLRAVEVYLCTNGIVPSRLLSWTDEGDEQYREQLAMSGKFNGELFHFFVGVCVNRDTLEKCNKAAMAHGMRSEIHGPYQLFFSDEVTTSKKAQDAIVAIFKAVPLKPQK